MHVVSKNKNTIMNLQTIIQSGKIKFDLSKGLAGRGFKMETVPFAKGSNRAAYMGHFETNHSPMLEDGEFGSTQAVVVKRSDVPANELLKIEAVCEVFAEKWNQEETSTEIEFLNLYMMDIVWDGKEEIVTVEEYINRGLYTKW